MIDALVAAAQQAEAVECRQRVGKVLIKRAATWRQQQQRARRVGFFYRSKHGLGRQHHACAATERRVVHAVMHVFCVFAQIVAAQVHNLFVARAAQQTLGAKCVHQVGEQCEDINPHQKALLEHRSLLGRFR